MSGPLSAKVRSTSAKVADNTTLHLRDDALAALWVVLYPPKRAAVDEFFTAGGPAAVFSALRELEGEPTVQTYGFGVLRTAQACKGGLSAAQLAQLSVGWEAAAVAVAAMRPRPGRARWRRAARNAAEFLERLINDQRGGAARLAAAEEAAQRGAGEAASAALWAHLLRLGDEDTSSALVTLAKMCSCIDLSEDSGTDSQTSAKGCGPRHCLAASLPRMVVWGGARQGDCAVVAGAWPDAFVTALERN